jgi:hypothetical protein
VKYTCRIVPDPDLILNMMQFVKKQVIVLFKALICERLYCLSMAIGWRKKAAILGLIGQ